MSKLKLVTLISLTIYLCGCSITNKIEVNKNVLMFKGNITKESVELALNEIKRSKIPITKMIVNSNGGNARASMILGEWIFDQKIELRVRKKCFSSCANYWLTASPNVVVEHGAIVGWHGGPLQEVRFPKGMPQEEREKISQNVKETRKIEAIFFNKIGVKKEITVFGQLNNYKKLKESSGCSPDLMGWTYSVSTMKKLGLKRVHFKDMEPALYYKGKKVQCMLEISDDELLQ